MVRVSHQRFERLVAQALDDLPEWVRARMENVEVLVADVPPQDEPNLLGRYEGIPLTRRGPGYFGVLPDRITLYRSTLQGVSSDELHLKRQIHHTVAHEVAHFFGISDERLLEIDRY